MSWQPLSAPRAILFDMDGTLTRPMLNFPAIKAEMGIGSRPILEAMAEMTDSQRQHAERVLFRHEARAAADSQLNGGCLELLDWIRGRSIPTALITRNSSESVNIVLQRHSLRFDHVVTREHGPFKPDPWPIRHCCELLKIAPQATWMVGDGQYDIEAGNGAGAETIWISHGRNRDFATEPRETVTGLTELLDRLRACR